MKFSIFFLLVALSVAIATDTGKPKIENYDLIDNPFEDPTTKGNPSMYMLETEVQNNATLSEPEAYRVCLVVQCYPRWSKFKICVCRVWRK